MRCNEQNEQRLRPTSALRLRLVPCSAFPRFTDSLGHLDTRLKGLALKNNPNLKWHNILSFIWNIARMLQIKKFSRFFFSRFQLFIIYYYYFYFCSWYKRYKMADLLSEECDPEELLSQTHKKEKKILQGLFERFVIIVNFHLQNIKNRLPVTPYA